MENVTATTLSKFLETFRSKRVIVHMKSGMLHEGKLYNIDNCGIIIESTYKNDKEEMIFIPKENYEYVSGWLH